MSRNVRGLKPWGIPYPWEDKAVDHILTTPSLRDDERIAILETTAAKLLRIS